MGESGIKGGTPQWKDQRGWLSAGSFGTDEEMVLQDGTFYQDFSYQVKSSISIDRFESIVKNLIHPSGMKMFSKVIEAQDLTTYLFRVSNYVDLVFDLNTVTRIDSGRPFDELFRTGDLLTISNTSLNDGQNIVGIVTALTMTFTGGTGVVAENATDDIVQIGAGIGVIDVAQENDGLELQYAPTEMQFDMGIMDGQIVPWIQQDSMLGFGWTWADAERTREVELIEVDTWIDLAVSDFHDRATERFLFIPEWEIDLILPISDVIWDTTPLTVSYYEDGSSSYAYLYFWNNYRPADRSDTLGSTVGYNVIDGDGFQVTHSVLEQGPPVWDPYTGYEFGEYALKWDLVSVVSGDIVNFHSDEPEGVWVDAFSPNFWVQDPASGAPHQEIIVDITFGKHDGTAVWPDPPVGITEAVTKRVTFISDYGVPKTASDTFGGSGAITAHTPNIDPSGLGWSDHGAVGGLLVPNLVYAGTGVTGESICILDSTISDTRLKGEFKTMATGGDPERFGMILNFQDINNYWECVVDDGDAVPSPSLKINQIKAGVRTTKNSVLLVNTGPINSGAPDYTSSVWIHFTREGDNLRGEFQILWERFTVDFTSADFKTETKHGFVLNGDASETRTGLTDWYVTTSKLIT